MKIKYPREAMRIDTKLKKRLKKWVGVWLAVFFFSGACLAAINTLTGAQVVAQNQLVFQLTEPFKYHYSSLPSPERLVIDFDKTVLKANLTQLAFGALPVKSIRTSMNSAKTLRIVLDLKAKLKPQFHVVPPQRGRQWQLWVSFSPMAMANTNTVKTLPSVSKMPTSSSMAAAMRPHTPVFANKRTVQKTPVKATKTVVKVNAKTPTSTLTSAPKANIKASYRPRSVIIVIDPGHGGKDPGAHGKQGTREKNVVLGIARRLQMEINRHPGMHAVLTRNGDYYIDLRQRLRIARKDSGDMFISIHADAFIQSSSYGVSVFALSEHGATSEAARWLAAKENYSELGGVDLNGLDDKNGMVRSVLIDLSQTATISASLELGTDVLHSLGQVTRLHHHFVEQAPFMVLKSPDIPSILIETGFISNPAEEIKLRSPAYQEQLAKAISLGAQNYFAQHPPMGSYWEAKN